MSDDDPIEEFIQGEAKKRFEQIMEGEREGDNSSLLLLGMSRLFSRMDELKNMMRNGMYPIWISIAAGVIAYIVINVLGI